MATLIIRDIPDLTYRRLKESAERHRRSLTKEALVVLEERLNPYVGARIDIRKLPQIKLTGKPDLSPEGIQAMIDQGRR
jgi:plasmid stability protein